MSCEICAGHPNCPVCGDPGWDCDECGIGTKIEIEKGVFQCDSCGNTDIFYDPDTEYDERRINERE